MVIFLEIFSYYQLSGLCNCSAVGFDSSAVGYIVGKLTAFVMFANILICVPSICGTDR